jgi:hypothetical protein
VKGLSRRPKSIEIEWGIVEVGDLRHMPQSPMSAFLKVGLTLVLTVGNKTPCSYK